MTSRSTGGFTSSKRLQGVVSVVRDGDGVTRGLEVVTNDCGVVRIVVTTRIADALYQA